jgi:hypothetical protein
MKANQPILYTTFSSHVVFSPSDELELLQTSTYISLAILQYKDETKFIKAERMTR